MDSFDMTALEIATELTAPLGTSGQSTYATCEQAAATILRQHEAIVKLRESLKDAVVALRHVESIGMRVNPPTLTVAEQALKDTEGL